MSLGANETASVAQSIPDRLGNQDARWTVTEVVPMDQAEHAAEIGPARDGLQGPRPILIRAVKTSDPSCTISATFNAVTLPTQQAIAQLADSMQDDVIETVRAAVPACPAHTHPLSVRMVDGRAVWACPSGVGPSEPISRDLQ